jgi:hypothetical protein
MIAGILADAVLVLHALFIAWVTLGAIAVARWPWLAWLHLPALGWGLWIEASGGLCPLTPLEVALRRAGGEQGYAGGFVEHYLGALVYPAGLTREAQWVLAAGLLTVNAGLYAWVLRRRARRAAGPARMR